MAPVRIAVAGAGLIGARHVEEVDACADAELAAIGPCHHGRSTSRGAFRRVEALLPTALPTDGVLQGLT